MVFLTTRKFRHSQWKGQTVCFRKQREENNFSHGIRFIYGSHCHRYHQGKWGSDRDEAYSHENGSVSGSRHKKQGRRPSSARQWSQPWAFLDEALHTQCFMIAIVHLSVTRETHTQNAESQVDAANIMLALSFWVSQLGGNWFELPCTCRRCSSSQCFTWEGYSFPWLNCQVLSDKIYKVVKCSLLNPHNDAAVKPDSAFLMSVLCQVMDDFRGKAKASPSGEIFKWAEYIMEHTVIYWTQDQSALT